jgi:hypothetical protein
MSNPFTAPTLSGYNSSPPSDDGSATAANTIQWQKHLDKIGDPLKTYAQAISSNASTAFGKMFGNDFVEKTANYTIATSDQGKAIIATTAALTFTLPAAATAGSNFVVVVKNSSAGSLTIDGNSSETINGSTTLSLPYSDQSAILVSDASSWYALLLGPEAGEIVRVLDTPQTFNLDTTLADITDFAITGLRADRWYEYEARFSYAQGGGDVKQKIVFSQTPQTVGTFLLEYVSETGDISVSSNTDITSQWTVTTMTDTDFVSVIITGAFKTNATTGGDIDLQGAQATSDSTDTKFWYGTLRLRDLGA